MEAQSAATTTYPSQHRGWVSSGVSSTGVQARIKSSSRERSQWFAYKNYGGKTQALRAAQAWLELQRRSDPALGPAVKLRTNVSPRKRDRSLPVGITESAYTLRSGNTGTRFQVLWHDGTYRRVKSFTIGVDGVATEADRRQALRKAVAFRKGYEAARKVGELFKPNQEGATDHAGPQ